MSFKTQYLTHNKASKGLYSEYNCVKGLIKSWEYSCNIKSAAKEQNITTEKIIAGQCYMDLEV